MLGLNWDWTRGAVAGRGERLKYEEIFSKRDVLGPSRWRDHRYF